MLGLAGEFPKLCVTAAYPRSILTQNLGWALVLRSQVHYESLACVISNLYHLRIHTAVPNQA